MQMHPVRVHRYHSTDMQKLYCISYRTASDPACGAGAMLIAFANAAKRHGINYQKHVLFVSQDIDRTAAMMCYIQMSLLGCPAVVVIGDSLTRPFPNSDNEISNCWKMQTGSC